MNQNNLIKIISMLSNLREPWGIKDLSSQHVYMNPAAYAYTNTPKHFSVEGKYDAEFPVGWSEFADDMVEHDRKAEHSDGERVVVIETYNWFSSNELTPYFCEKIPFFSDEKIIGTLWTARPILSVSPLILTSRVKKCSPVDWRTSYQGPFTNTELETLFLLLCGLTKQKIAEKSSVSKRTIDNRVQRMYQKINVHNFKQFQEYCYAHSLHGYIPPSFIKKGSIAL